MLLGANGTCTIACEKVSRLWGWRTRAVEDTERNHMEKGVLAGLRWPRLMQWLSNEAAVPLGVSPTRTSHLGVCLWAQARYLSLHLGSLYSDCGSIAASIKDTWPSIWVQTAGNCPRNPLDEGAILNTS